MPGIIGSYDFTTEIDANSAQYDVKFYGVIYNLREFEAEFGRLPVERLLAEGIAKHGVNFAQKLRGSFAFSLFDGKKLRIFRDHMGTKPLFYARRGNKVAFASEISALFEGGIKPQVNLDSFREIFAIGPARTSGHGVFVGVHEVPPACCISFSMGASNQLFEQPCRYWQLKAGEHTDNYADTVEQVRALLIDAIHEQITETSYLCSLLSGGIDSSIITAVAARKLGGLSTFSFVFAGND